MIKLCFFSCLNKQIHPKGRHLFLLRDFAQRGGGPCHLSYLIMRTADLFGGEKKKVEFLPPKLHKRSFERAQITERQLERPTEATDLRTLCKRVFCSFTDFKLKSTRRTWTQTPKSHEIWLFLWDRFNVFENNLCCCCCCCCCMCSFSQLPWNYWCKMSV